MWVHPPVGPARLPEQGLSWLPPEDLTLLTCRSEAKASSDSFHLAEGRTLRAFRKAVFSHFLALTKCLLVLLRSELLLRLRCLLIATCELLCLARLSVQRPPPCLQNGHEISGPRQRWSKMQDSSSDSADDAAPTAPRLRHAFLAFPRTVLHAYLRGVLFSRRPLQQSAYLLYELPADTPCGLLRDLVCLFSFDVDTVLLHVNNFLHDAASRAVIGAALRQWLGFIWLECLQPTLSSRAAGLLLGRFAEFCAGFLDEPSKRNKLFLCAKKKFLQPAVAAVCNKATRPRGC